MQVFIMNNQYKQVDCIDHVSYVLFCTVCYLWITLSVTFQTTPKLIEQGLKQLITVH